MIKSAAALLTEGTYASLRRSPGVDRLRRGVYNLGDPASGVERHLQQIRATEPLLGGGAIFSHVSAAVMHGLPVLTSWLDTPWITQMSGAGGHKRRWLHSVRGALNSDEIVLVNGVRVTSVARTCIDLARMNRAESAVPVVDAALRAGLDRDSLFDVLEMHPRVRGNGQARWAAGFADALSESFGESRSRVVLHDLGLPPPLLQHEIFDADGVFVARVDFAWDELKLVGEFDGFAKYDQLRQPGTTARDALLKEKRRDEAIRDAGWWPVHWWWEDLVNRQTLGERLRVPRR